jgi:hypothetical protein
MVSALSAEHLQEARETGKVWATRAIKNIFAGGAPSAGGP